MPTLNIDTTAPGYQQRLSGLQDFIQFARPWLRLYARLPGNLQQAWRENDPLLDLTLKFAERLGDALDD
jgi:hypothetical protein